MLNKIIQELMNEQGSHYMPIEKILSDQNVPKMQKRQPTANFEVSDNEEVKQKKDTPQMMPSKMNSFNYYPENLAKRAQMSHSLAMPYNDNSVSHAGYNSGNDRMREMSDPRTYQRDPYHISGQYNNFDPIKNQDDLILDIKLQRGSQNRHLSQTNSNAYPEMEKPRDLPRLSNIRHDNPVSNSEAKNWNAPYSGLASTKLPKINRIAPKNSRITKTIKKTGQRLPHYMQLRRQDMDNKIITKRKIKEIKESKPKLISTPKKRWIPLKIEPKGAALNAKFYKGKPKPSIEFSRSDQESSAKRLRKLRKMHPNDSSFDRSESHCRR